MTLPSVVRYRFVSGRGGVDRRQISSVLKTRGLIFIVAASGDIMENVAQVLEGLRYSAHREKNVANQDLVRLPLQMTDDVHRIHGYRSLESVEKDRQNMLQKRYDCIRAMPEGVTITVVIILGPFGFLGGYLQGRWKNVRFVGFIVN